MIRKNIEAGHDQPQQMMPIERQPTVLHSERNVLKRMPTTNNIPNGNAGRLPHQSQKRPNLDSRIRDMIAFTVAVALVETIEVERGIPSLENSPCKYPSKAISSFPLSLIEPTTRPQAINGPLIGDTDTGDGSPLFISLSRDSGMVLSPI